MVISYETHKSYASQRTIKEKVRVIRKDIFGPNIKKDVSFITKESFDKSMRSIEARSPALARNAKSYASSFFNYLISLGFLSSNHALGFNLLPALRKPKDFSPPFSDEALGKIWNSSFRMTYPTGHIVRLLILTGKRRREISDLRWNEVDLVAQTLKLSASRMKSNRNHTVNLGPNAIDLVKSIKRLDNDFVFPTGKRAVKSVSHFDAIKRQAQDLSGTSGWTFHDFRRMFASMAAKNGVRPEVYQMLLDHELSGVIGITAQYVRHDFEIEKREWMVKYENYIMDIALQNK